MSQPPVTIRVMSNQTGMPHNNTLRKPGLYTARISTTARKTQIMLLTGRHVAIGVAGDRPIDRCHGGRGRQLVSRSAHLLQDHLLLKRGERWPVGAASQEQGEEGERFHRIDSRPLGREPSIAYSHRTVQNGVTL